MNEREESLKYTDKKIRGQWSLTVFFCSSVDEISSASQTITLVVFDCFVITYHTIAEIEIENEEYTRIKTTTTKTIDNIKKVHINTQLQQYMYVSNTIIIAQTE